MGAGFTGSAPWLCDETLGAGVAEWSRVCILAPATNNTTMSDTKNNGGPAFPLMDSWWKGPDEAYYAGHSEGMTLRDYFAAKAMVAVLTGHQRKVSEVAEEAYAVADAMLKARQ